ncbi:MAG: phage gp6-like head-tail connector protein [Caldilinea sp.]|nr:phage gp6-like head-tail connector protein [Caldilinea sp.]
MAAYCTAAEVKAFGRDSTLDDAVLLLLIESVSDLVDRWCRRTFVPASGTRTYDRIDGKTIRLDRELVALTRITTNAGQTFLPASVRLEPRSGPPYLWLTLTGYSDQFLYSGTEVDAVSVEGTWGYKATVPNPIRLATMKWVLTEYNKADVQGFNSIGAAGMSVGMAWASEAAPPMEVQEILALYRRRRIEAAVNGQ